jgi:hypothetical protein
MSTTLLQRPIGKHVLMVLSGLAAVLLAVDSSWLSPNERTLRITGYTYPAPGGAPESVLVPLLEASYISSNMLRGCTSWSIRGDVHDVIKVRRHARLREGRFEVELPLKDFSTHKCQYRLMDISMGIAPLGKWPDHQRSFFGYGEKQWRGEALDVYCFSPARKITASTSNWDCSAEAEANKPLNFDLDNVPSELVMNLHRLDRPPYEQIF